MSVTVRDHAPDLELEAYVSASREPKLRGLLDRAVLLPRDFTFVCPTELQAFAELEADFTAEDAVLIAVSTDSYWSHKAWFESNPVLADVRYPVVADTSHASRAPTASCSLTAPRCARRT